MTLVLLLLASICIGTAAELAAPRRVPADHSWQPDADLVLDGEPVPLLTEDLP